MCLFLLFRKCWRSSSSVHQLAGNGVCQVVFRFVCGFVQISLILLCILLKLDIMAAIDVAYLVSAAAFVGGEKGIYFSYRLQRSAY